MASTGKKWPSHRKQKWTRFLKEFFCLLWLWVIFALCQLKKAKNWFSKLTEGVIFPFYGLQGQKMTRNNKIQNNPLKNRVHFCFKWRGHFWPLEARKWTRSQLTRRPRELKITSGNILAGTLNLRGLDLNHMVMDIWRPGSTVFLRSFLRSCRFYWYPWELSGSTGSPTYIHNY